MDSNFKELSNDTSIIGRIQQFSKAEADIEHMINQVCDPEFYNSLNNTDKIKYNLMMSFALNSLFWMHLRAEGLDPLNHPIKGENARLKQAMAKAQEIRDRKTTMPRLNKDAATRFIRNGLWTPNDVCEDNAEKNFNRDEKWDIQFPNKTINK